MDVAIRGAEAEHDEDIRLLEARMPYFQLVIRGLRHLC